MIAVLNTQVQPPGQVLLVVLVTKIDTSILSFFFRHLNETSQPLQEAIKNLQAG